MRTLIFKNISPKVPKIRMDENRLQSFFGRPLLSIDDFSRAELEHIISLAAELKKDSPRGRIQVPERYRTALKDQTGALIFLEPSTRTLGSFKRAGELLGANRPIIIADPKSSSFAKNESIADALRTLVEQHGLSYVVIRSSEEGVAWHSARVLDEYCNNKGYSRIPVFNAGDGRHEHPSQAILDMFTIKARMGRLNNLNIVLQGDLENSRTIHSLLKVLLKYEGNNYTLLSAPEFKLPELYKERIKRAGGTFVEAEEYSTRLLEGKDVLYLSRPQKERFDQGMSEDRKEEYIRKLTLQLNHLPTKNCPWIMHALPIDGTFGEVEEQVKDHPRFIAFEQAGNGTWTRAAELLLVLTKSANGDLQPFVSDALEARIDVREESIPADVNKLRQYTIGPIQEGWAIDKIPDDFRLYMRILELMGPPTKQLPSGRVTDSKGKWKYVVKYEGVDVPEERIKRVLLLSPGIVVNKIEYKGDTIDYPGKSGRIEKRNVGRVTQKLTCPSPNIIHEVYACPNSRCITQKPNVRTEFHLIGGPNAVYACSACDTLITTAHAAFKT